MKRYICIELSQTNLQESENNENLVGLLEMNLNGTRHTTSNFQDDMKVVQSGTLTTTLDLFDIRRLNLCVPNLKENVAL